MKKILITTVLVAWAIGAAAQTGAGVAAAGPGAEGVRERLAAIDYGGASSAARIEVSVTDDARGAIRSADLTGARTTIKAYGVRLFSDSSQQGRENAYGAEKRFEEAWPGIGADVTYETPAFWVTAGCFVDRIDAVALCGRVLGQFPRAFVVPMDVPVSRIISKEKTDTAPTSEPSQE
jgi:hypothetical protein